MASGSVKKVQDKLFGRNPTPLQSDHDRDTSLQPQADSDTAPTPLTINIPKPQPTPTYPARKVTDSSPKDATENTFTQATEAERRPYRERLAQQLGDQYKGAEKYRLREDDERKKHWKRWGPYLSDRQWVRSLSDCIFLSFFIGSYGFFRLPFERTTRMMVILGLTSLMLMQDLERTDGGRMVLLVFLIIINVYALVYLSGMGRILFLKNAYTVSLTTKETMART